MDFSSGAVSAMRINAQMMGQRQLWGQLATLVGVVKMVNGDHRSFMVESSDGKNITVRMRSRLEEELQPETIIELDGNILKANEFECQMYTIWPTSVQEFSHENSGTYLLNELALMVSGCGKVLDRSQKL